MASVTCGRCWKCKEGTGCIRGVSFSAIPGGARNQETVRINQTDKRWDKDMPAYKRLRNNGLQPKRIDDSAELEARATDQFEVEMGKIVPKSHRSQVKEGLATAKELELAPSQMQKKPGVANA